MIDLVIRNGLVVDGTGRRGFVGDIGIRDGTIVQVGEVDSLAKQEVDADGLVVAPGFIDVHTHYDAQVFWDGSLSPSPLHGVTTVVSGNCGFTLAPISEQDQDYMLRMLAQVEGMPYEALARSVRCDWNSTAEYLDAVEDNVVLNIGFLVGHSALRRRVLHEEATERPARPEEVEEMRQLLAEGLAAGGLGFSSTWSSTHSDHNGKPVPSRAASREELLALCEVVPSYDGTSLEFIPGLGLFDESSMELMAAMSRTAERPLNWNMLMVYPGNEEQVASQLAASDYAAGHGGRVIALTLPDLARLRLNFVEPNIFDQFPGWDGFWAASPADRMLILSDPDRRQELDAAAQATPPHLRQYAQWGAYRLETFGSAAERYNGQTVHDAATEMGYSDWEALCAVLVLDDLQSGVFMPPRGNDDATWARRQAVWRDPRTVIGASDAGAHLDMVDSFSYSTRLLEAGVRERPLLTLEEAVRMLTGDAAALYGLRDRGRLAAGYKADLVLLDMDSISAGQPTTRYDLPDGSGRLYSEPEGVSRVYINGVLSVASNKLTGNRPGTVLRSGRDTTGALQH
jgi:N-acyl-D-aspartate/D-glutamate deacylase